MRDEELSARRQQAEIDAEHAVTRQLEAEVEFDAIARVRRSLEGGDGEAIAEAAVGLHRLHALHEAQAGRTVRAEAAIARAVAAHGRLLRLRARRWG